MSEAIALHESTLKLFESKLGTDNPETLQCFCRASRNGTPVRFHAGPAPSLGVTGEDQHNHPAFVDPLDDRGAPWG
jgi:hypothetical protein